MKRGLIGGREMGDFKTIDEALVFAASRFGVDRKRDIIPSGFRKIKTKFWHDALKENKCYSLVSTKNHITESIWTQTTHEMTTQSGKIHIVVGKVPFSEKYSCWGIDRHGTIFSILKPKKKMKLGFSDEGEEPSSSKQSIKFEDSEVALDFMINQYWAREANPDSLLEIIGLEYIFFLEESDLANPKISSSRKAVHRSHIAARRIFLINVGQDIKKFFVGKFKSGFGCWVFEDDGKPKIVGVPSKKSSYPAYKKKKDISTTRCFEGLYKAYGIDEKGKKIA